MRFQGKVALVTGAGSGIGRAVALKLAAEGATVAGHDVNEERLAETAGLVSSGTITTRVGDISDPAECRAVVEAVVAEHGGLDILGNIAGIARAEHFTEVTVEQYRQMMGVNVDAYYFLAQAAIPHLLERNGNIVNIASNAGLMGQAYTVAYCMSKGAVVQFTRALAMEFMKKPLRVNAIAPGGVMTNLVTGFQFPEGDLEGDLMGRYSGFRGLTEADEVANLFLYLASDEARSIHGTTVSIDHGVTAG